MARRKRRYTRTRKIYRRARSPFTKKAIINNLIDGGVAGGIQAMIPDDMLYGYGDTLALAGWGWFRKNAVLQTIAGYQLGLKLASNLTGGSQGGAGFRGQA